MRSGDIKIVNRDGELLFECDGILMDVLYAHDLYVTNIVIERDGKKFDTGSVEEDDCIFSPILFWGLQKIIGTDPTKESCKRVLPEQFMLGDIIHFEKQEQSCTEIDFRETYVFCCIRKMEELASFVFPEHPILRRRQKK